MQDQCYSLKETAQFLSITRQTLWRLIRDKKIQSICVSERRKVILKSELDRYIQSLKG